LEALNASESGDSALLTLALQQLNIFNETGEYNSLPPYVENIVSSISEKSGRINFELMCKYLSDSELTKEFPNSAHWIAFRDSLGGQRRKRGHLRIHYTLDGWPRHKTIPINKFTSLTDVTNNSQVELSLLIPFVDRELGKEEEFVEFRMRDGLQGQWKPRDKTSTISVSFGKDGWGEVFIWLRSKSFIAKKGGIPF